MVSISCRWEPEPSPRSRLGEMLLIPVPSQHACSSARLPKDSACWLLASPAGCRQQQAAGSRGHREGRQPLASSPGRLSDRQQPGGSGEGTQAAPPTPLAGDTAGHTSRRFKRRRRGLSVMGGGRGLLETGKGKRGPGAGDKVQPSHTGRSGQTKTGTGCWLLGGTAALLLPDGQWARRLQTASERTMVHLVQTSCGLKQHWDFHPVQRSANAKLKETAQASSSSPNMQIPCWKATTFPSRTLPWSQTSAVPWGSSEV